MPSLPADVSARCDRFREDYRRVQQEIGKVIVGHADIVDGVLTCLFVGGHALLEGVPGLGKTALIRALAGALDLKFSRIQFTPDLMPADVLGTNVIDESASGRREFRFMPGPIFAQIVLADEINRATPKTQSALLEAMQERQVTAGGEIRRLQPPFFVMATQNPIEQEGTYPLPEAQLDRFFFKLLVQYSSRDELHQILDRTTAGATEPVRPVLDGERILAHQSLVREVVVARHVQDYAVRLVLGTHPGSPYADAEVTRYLRYGASPRAAQALVLAGKVRALLDARFNVSFSDLRQAVLPALRHRILLNFEAEAEGVSPDRVLETLIAKTPDQLEENR
ncbi:MAG: AAA family ATPase [Tepidisphaerales bacterium]